MVERVIVATDGGNASSAALEWVIERAKSVAMTVTITTVVEDEWELPGGAEVDFRAPYEQALHTAKERLAAAAPKVKVSTQTLRGFPAAALIEASLDGDLLVVGTNRTPPLAGIAHGTLALKVAGQAGCPTVVVPAGWSAGGGQVVAGWDDDRTSDAALDLAAAEAVRAGRPLVVVHSWRVPAAIGVETAGSGIMFEALASANLELLTEATDRIRKAHPDLSVSGHLETGSAAISLVKAAKDASLVVVGSRGRGVIAGFVLGSVSHDLLMNMPAPVMVVPHVDEPVDVYPEIVDEDLL